jgi:hypothetical protein
MKKIDININKAELQRVTLVYQEKKLEVTASINLYAGDKKITSFEIGTESWRDDNFNVPPSCIISATSIRQALEPIIVAKCLASLKQLPETATNEVEVTPEEPEDDLPF